MRGLDQIGLQNRIALDAASAVVANLQTVDVLRLLELLFCGFFIWDDEWDGLLCRTFCHRMAWSGVCGSF